MIYFQNLTIIKLFISMRIFFSLNVKKIYLMGRNSRKFSFNRDSICHFVNITKIINQEYFTLQNV
jgi:hypothetical protein